jgi:hypothetical protein
MHEFSAAAMPSEAKATKKRGLIAALKRCATQNLSVGANFEGSSGAMPNVGSSSRGDMR